MSDRKYDNSGSIFRNDKKAENPSRPDYTGSALIDGVDYWVSCWVKESKTGSKFFSCTYRRKDNQPAATQPAATQPVTELEKPIFPDTGEELPF